MKERYEREILKIESKINPPKVDLAAEKKHSELVRHLIIDGIINACHDVSDGGILVTLFEMCITKNTVLGCRIENSFLGNHHDYNALLFGEDQGRYIVTLPQEKAEFLIHLAFDVGVEIFRIGEIVPNQIIVNGDCALVQNLQNLNDKILPQKLSLNTSDDL